MGISAREDKVGCPQFTSNRGSCHIADDALAHSVRRDSRNHVGSHVCLVSVDIAYVRADHAVKIGRLNAIGIYEDELAHAEMRQLFGGNGACATQTHYRDSE